MLYTPIPWELIWEGYDDVPEYQEIQWEGRLLTVIPSWPTGGQVVRLHSSNPMDYLDPRFQPGQLIHIDPEQQI